MTYALRECPLAIHSTLLLGRLNRRQAWLSKLILCEQPHRESLKGRVRLVDGKLRLAAGFRQRPLTALQETVPNCSLGTIVKAEWLAYRLHSQLGYCADVSKLEGVIEDREAVAKIVARAYQLYLGREVETVEELIEAIS